MNSVPWLPIIGIWLINFGISWWNAVCCGKAWLETKHMGGWPRFMNWMGAIMSASGFTWCYLIALLLITYYLQPFAAPLEPGMVERAKEPFFDARAVHAGLSLGYLIIIPGVLFSGLMIWVDSLANAWRRRDLPSILGASWNTYAQLHNTYNAYRGMGGAAQSVADFFKEVKSSGGGGKKDGKAMAALLLIVLVIVAIIGGVLTTWGIISHFAAQDELPEHMKAQLRERRHELADRH